MKKISRVLITGSQGQLGRSFIDLLNKKIGADNILSTDLIDAEKAASLSKAKNYAKLDVTDKQLVKETIRNFQPTHVMHLAAILSATGEKNPQWALKINEEGFKNILDESFANDAALYVPSTIGVFGPTTPRYNTPNNTILQPQTVYGISKIMAELLGSYYAHRYNFDFRSLRYPGVVSALPPGGGTTDYIIEMYYAAVNGEEYKCFLHEDTPLPMIHLDDCIKGTIEFMEVDSNLLSEKVYNMSGFSVTPKDVERSIKKFVPGFRVRYEPDFRQKIADSWPASIDGSLAKNDWGYSPKYVDVDTVTKDILMALNKTQEEIADQTEDEKEDLEILHPLTPGVDNGIHAAKI